MSFEFKRAFAPSKYSGRYNLPLSKVFVLYTDRPKLLYKYWLLQGQGFVGLNAEDGFCRGSENLVCSHSPNILPFLKKYWYNITHRIHSEGI